MPSREEIIQGRVDAALAEERAQQAEIRAAVYRARPKLPDLPRAYADQAIASGRNLDQVKGDLVDLMSAQTAREASMANMKKQVAGMGPDPSAKPTGDAGLSRASMERELKRAGVAPSRG